MNGHVKKRVVYKENVVQTVSKCVNGHGILTNVKNQTAVHVWSR